MAAFITYSERVTNFDGALFRRLTGKGGRKPNRFSGLYLGKDVGNFSGFPFPPLFYAFLLPEGYFGPAKCENGRDSNSEDLLDS